MVTGLWCSQPQRSWAGPFPGSLVHLHGGRLGPDILLVLSSFSLGKFGDFSQTARRVGRALLLLRHWGPVGPPAFLWFGMLERTARNAWEFLLHFPLVFLGSPEGVDPFCLWRNKARRLGWRRCFPTDCGPSLLLFWWDEVLGRRRWWLPQTRCLLLPPALVVGSRWVEEVVAFLRPALGGVFALGNLSSLGGGM